MASLANSFFSRLRSRRASPTETVGVRGTAIHGGHIEHGERSRELSSTYSRYHTYADILANTSIVAAGVRYFLNLVAKAAWTFTPSEDDTTGEYAERVEAMLKKDPATPWHRIVRRAAMYRFYGFSVQEWTARRRDDGLFTFADIEPRAQRTIERWDVDPGGAVLGTLQRSPQTQIEIYLPRSKLVYIVDDSLNDSPEGMGLFRHLVEPTKRLARYEQLEGFGFESDLKGIPVARAPFSELQAMVDSGDLTDEQRLKIEEPLRRFIKDHIKTPDLGLLLDSITYTTSDDATKPSLVKQWDIDILKGTSNSFRENAAAIERLNRELARILGVEQLLLGSTGTGSLALSRDKTSSFFLLVDGALTEIREAFEADLIDKLWMLNGWDLSLKPQVAVESVKGQDIEQIAGALRDLATAGAPMLPDDPAVAELRALLGPVRAGGKCQLARAGRGFEQRWRRRRELRSPSPCRARMAT